MAQDKSHWILMTGVTRGIGRALSQELRRKGFLVCGLVRRESAPKMHSELDHVIPWDLDWEWEKNSPSAWATFVREHCVVGFIHAAGQLGPMQSRSSDVTSAEWASWWNAYSQAIRVNHTAGLELSLAVRSHLQQWSNASGERRPFLLHLSSGAAVKPYVGWEAYCSSKAAMLMAFKCLAAQDSPEVLNVLSVAPGTVMTDMMQQVLSANASEFPALSKFKELEKTGGLVSPEVPALKISDWLVDSEDAEIKRWHGELFDVRNSISANGT
ncbi:MAG: hypothetical protein RIR26_657 [Pseudomonadota bacterium]|jgi:NAD(P)-dependent dehydrogenase (short-subunit alcohol dehydrogenase family)